MRLDTIRHTFDGDLDSVPSFDDAHGSGLVPLRMADQDMRPCGSCGPSCTGTITCSHPRSQARAFVSAKRSITHGFHHNLPILEQRSAYK